METTAGGLSVTASVVIALALTLSLAALHLAAPRLRRLEALPERVIGSFAGGLAVAYVFLHLLPEVAEGSEAFTEVLGGEGERSPLLELSIFGLALLGFTVFYGLEQLARRHGAARGGPGAGDGPGVGVYRLHLGSFLVYNGLITYTMALRVRTGLLFALLFTLAMALHFVLTDRGLEENYPRRFAHGGRWALAAALVGGWALGAVLAPTSELAVAALTAALSGSILLNVFKEEVPEGRRSSFAWFLTGLVVYAALLAAVTALAE